MVISSSNTDTRVKVDIAGNSLYRQATLDALQHNSVNDVATDMTADFRTQNDAFVENLSTQTIDTKPFQSKDIGLSTTYAGVTSTNIDKASSFMQYKQAAEGVLVETATDVGAKPELQNGALTAEFDETPAKGDFVQTKCEPSQSQDQDVTLKTDGIKIEFNHSVHDKLDNNINALQQRMDELTKALDETATFKREREQLFTQTDRKLTAMRRNIDKQTTQQESERELSQASANQPEKSETEEVVNEKVQKTPSENRPAGLKNATEQATGAAMGMTTGAAKGLSNATRGITRFAINATKHGINAYQNRKGNMQLQQSALTINSQTSAMKELPALLHRIDSNIDAITSVNSGNEVFLNGKFKELNNDLKSLHQYHRRSLQQGHNLAGAELDRFVQQRQKDVDMTNQTISKLNVHSGQLQATADKIGFKIDLHNIKDNISKAVDQIQHTLSSLKNRFASAMSPSK